MDLLHVLVVLFALMHVTYTYKCISDPDYPETDRRSIEDSFICDHYDDCLLGDDEEHCKNAGETAKRLTKNRNSQVNWLEKFMKDHYAKVGGCGRPSLVPKFIRPLIKSKAGEYIGFSRMKRMINGNEVVHGSWPWQVALQISIPESEDGGLVFCAGTLIHSRWVLTAAHCIESVRKKTSKPVIKVLLGRHDVTMRSEFLSKSIESRIFFKHPNHRYPMHKSNDIALIKLPKPIKLNEHIKIACLPLIHDVKDEEKSCFMTGWGRASGTQEDIVYPKQLLQLRFPIVSRKTCTRQTSWSPEKITNKQICAGMADGDHDMCWGDSGGGLVCMKNGRYTVHGVSSFTGHLCAVLNKPAVFTRVYKYMEWIGTTIRKHN